MLIYDDWKKAVAETLGSRQPLFEKIVEEIRQADGKVLAVGGWVRDLLMGLRPRDLDVEIYNIEKNALKEILSKHGKLNEIGERFVVLKLHNIDVDFALPRRDEKTGEGHKGFEIQHDPNMNVVEAAMRRDLTVNAIAMDMTNGKLIDPFDGISDIEARCLTAVNPKSFTEDPCVSIGQRNSLHDLILIPTGS